MTAGSPRYACEGCHRRAAGGGQRFCWSCLVDIFFGQPTGTTARQEEAKRRFYHSGMEEAHLGDTTGGASLVEIYNQHGKVIRRSRNLRGILDHARRVDLWAASAYPQGDGKGVLCVTFADASSCETEFASYQVLCQWLCARRSWAGARHLNGSASPRF